MNKELVRKAGESPVDNLINSTTPPALPTGVLVRGEQGLLARGTVLALSSKQNDTVMLGAEPEQGEELTARYILADPVDAGGEEAVPGTAYRTGHFNRPALIVAKGHTLTRADEESLRDGGILLSDALA
jgi:hypothetical protein